MAVDQKIVDDCLRLEFKYKIRSGPTEVKSYGLALARCLRFPSTLIDRAEDIIEAIADESFINIPTRRDVQQNVGDDDQSEMNSSSFSQEICDLDREVVDAYSFVLLLMSTKKEENVNWISVATVNQKLDELLKKMTPELQEMIKMSPLEQIIRMLNSSSTTNG
jgi:DNA mismatch repair ATPase MutS